VVAEISVLGAVLWWLALAAFYLGVIPAVILVANRLIRAVREIRAYAEDVLEHGVGITRELEPVPELLRTREAATEIAAGIERYSKALKGRG
jgi:hypothetical protein